MNTVPYPPEPRAVCCITISPPCSAGGFSPCPKENIFPERPATVSITPTATRPRSEGIPASVAGKQRSALREHRHYHSPKSPQSGAYLNIAKAVNHTLMLSRNTLRCFPATLADCRGMSVLRARLTDQAHRKILTILS